MPPRRPPRSGVSRAHGGTKLHTLLELGSWTRILHGSNSISGSVPLCLAIGQIAFKGGPDELFCDTPAIKSEQPKYCVR